MTHDPAQDPSPFTGGAQPPASEGLSVPRDQAGECHCHNGAPEPSVLVRHAVPLSRLSPGDVGQVASVGSGVARERLLELGLTTGAGVELVRFAPLGDPVDVKVRGYRLSLRRREAEDVMVYPGKCPEGCPVDEGCCLDPTCVRTLAFADPTLPVTYALVGNPNSGKTTLFNALTGLRQRVGNYPGVTVDKKEGRFETHGRKVRLLDLPGLYSLSPQSPDEAIARDVLMDRIPDTPQPQAIINIVDANNLERNLLLTSQLMDLGLPMVVVLTMSDVARRNGVSVDPARLERALGVPVRAVVVNRRQGMGALRETLAARSLTIPPVRAWTAPPIAEEALADVQESVCKNCNLEAGRALAEAILFLSRGEPAMRPDCPPEVRAATLRHRSAMEREGLDFAQAVTEARYGWVSAVVQAARKDSKQTATDWSDRVDRVLLHKVWGYLAFLGLMAVVFQTIFTLAALPMDLIGAAVDGVSGYVTTHMPAGDLRDLIASGVLGGVGTMLTFLPQILLLFFFIGLLEDSGYMARAAFLMDRLMSRVGLHGKSFIPMMSSFACAIPGVLATRTIDNRRARLVTIMVAPLMSCSARLPVYALMIAATIPAVSWFGVISLPGLTLLAMYLLGTVAAFAMAWLFRKTLLKGEANLFLMELPPYRLPQLRTVALQMMEKTGQFVVKAGTIILAMSVVMWFLSTYPKSPGLPPSQQVEQSFAGRAGKLLEPAIKPLGFDWRIGISMVSSFAAREVFVSSMATIYAAEDSDDGIVTLQNKLRNMVDPETGKRIFTPLLGIAVMIYYVLAMQCISTIAVVRRETGGWKWPLFQLAYMTALAWIVTFAVYQGGKALGLG